MSRERPEDARLTLLLHAATELAKREATASLGAIGLTVRHFTILWQLGNNGPMRQQEIAGRLGIDSATMVGLIDDLEGRDLLVRRRDPADRRAYAIELTDAGRATQADAAGVLDACEQKFAAALSAADRRQLAQLLTRLIRTP